MRCTLTLVLMIWTTNFAQAGVVLDPSAAITGTGGPAGLNGTYYHEGSGTTNYSVATTLALMAASQATGTFVSTSINYTGNDTSSITAFLGMDKSSYKGTAAAANDLSDAILHLTGYYYVSTAGTVTFSISHDDATQLSIGGKVIASSNLGTDTASVTFTAPGYYLLDDVYSNTNYNNGTGGASLTLRVNGSLLTSADVVQTVIPEPASLALLGGGLVLARLIRRRA